MFFYTVFEQRMAFVVLMNPLDIHKSLLYNLIANSKVSVQLQLLYSALCEPFQRIKNSR